MLLTLRRVTVFYFIFQYINVAFLFCDSQKNRVSVLAVLICILSGCIRNYDSSGYTFDPELEKKITVGLSKEGVLQTMGTPSMQSLYGEEIWYYLSTKREKIAFFSPSIIDQQVLAIAFTNDTVSKVTRYTGKDAKQIAYSGDATPSYGNNPSAVDQFLGNIGKFNPASRPTSLKH